MEREEVVIPYELIVPSASRPHLLRQTLSTLFIHTWRQWPQRVIVHDDGVFPGKRREVEDLLVTQVPAQVPLVFRYDERPIGHGPALKWLLDEVRTEYVLYTQDDFATVRPLPIARALALMEIFHLNQIRFNKRKTMAVKGEPGRTFTKLERRFSVAEDAVTDGLSPEVFEAVLCAADHWYFQTGLWRVAAIKPVVDWWASSGPERNPSGFTEHAEIKINNTFNGYYRGMIEFPSTVPVSTSEESSDPRVRARVHKTFIWGPVREPKFVEHLGHDQKNWALNRASR